MDNQDRKLVGGFIAFLMVAFALVCALVNNQARTIRDLQAKVDQCVLPVEVKL